MVMTLEPSQKERDILEALQNVDTWLDRNEIAEIIGRNRLNPHDIEVLEGLVESGQVIRDTKVSGIIEKYIYKVEK